jgi:hypothetical protein
MNFLELTLKTIENQIQIIRELVKKDSPVCVSTGETVGTTAEPSYALATLRLKEEELDQMRCENERLRSTIENLVLNTVPNSQLDSVPSSQLDLEFQRGFNEGVKSAQQEQIITGLNSAEMDDTPEQEYLGQLENDVQEAEAEAEAEATPVPVPELVTENNVESVNMTTETHAQNMEKEGATEGATEEDDEEELVEVEFNGKTYYYHEESGQIFTTDEAGEVDINVPVGRWSDKKQQFVLFRQ